MLEKCEVKILDDDLKGFVKDIYCPDMQKITEVIQDIDKRLKRSTRGVGVLHILGGIAVMAGGFALFNMEKKIDKLEKKLDKYESELEMATDEDDYDVIDDI